MNFASQVGVKNNITKHNYYYIDLELNAFKLQMNEVTLS